MSEISERCGGGDAGRPLVAGTLRGYRTWRGVTRWTQIPEGSLPLTAVTQRGVIWSPVLTARCSPLKLRRPSDSGAEDPSADHRAPSPGCTCGIYAWYEPEDAGILNARVFGAIQASGVVLMGDRGFRAERARVVAVVTRNRRLCAACEEAGIAVYRSRRSLLRDYPPEDVQSLLGARPAAEVEPRDAFSPTTTIDHRMLVYAVCGRALVIALAALLLPGIAAAALIVVVELMLILLLATRLP